LCKGEIVEGNIDLEERHRVFISLPPIEDFEDGKYFNMIFDFAFIYVFKLYGTGKMRAAMESSPGSGPMDLVTMSDFAYVIAMIENKKKVWEQQAEMEGMSPEEKKRFKEGGDYVKEEPKFTSREGRKYDYLGCGWTKKGRMFYDQV